MARPVAVFLVVLLAFAPARAHAQSLQASAQRAAKMLAVQPQQQSASRSMEPKFLWTGVGLLGGGGLIVLAAALVGGDDCTTSSGPNFTQTVCLKTDTTVPMIFGAVVAGAGAAVLAIGAAKAHSTTVSVTPSGGVVVRQKMPLSRLTRAVSRR